MLPTDYQEIARSIDKLRILDSIFLWQNDKI